MHDIGSEFLYHLALSLNHTINYYISLMGVINPMYDQTHLAPCLDQAHNCVGINLRI